MDLDGTLVSTDMLLEGLLALGGTRDWLEALRALGQGKAAFKAAVARGSAFDPALLPYNPAVLAHLQAERRRGRRLVLVTAADRTVAGRIAGHLGLFDEVIASDGAHNLKGEAKAAALVGRFGKGGFAYAGNDASDLPVWRDAGAAIIVNAPAAVAARARESPGSVVEMELKRAPVGRALLRAMRPQQWIKNSLALVPVFTAYALEDARAWLGACAVALAFCACASGIYLVNDMLDLAADRAHSRKRHRPLASGALPLPVGALAALLLLPMGLLLGAYAGAATATLAYVAASMAYSAGLKRIALVDVFVLSGLFTLRIYAGGEASGHKLSLWLLAFSGFLFLGLALMKRVQETLELADAGRGVVPGRGYAAADAQVLLLFGCGAAFSASLVMALYVQSATVAEHFATAGLLWATVPLLLFWQLRLWLATVRRQMHHDPIVHAARDPVSWGIGLAVILVTLAAREWGG